MVKRVCFILLLCLMPLGGVAAQEEPDPGVIFEHSVQVFFPVGVEFRANLAIQSEFVQSGTLTLSQASGYMAAFPIVLPSQATPAEGEEPIKADLNPLTVDTSTVNKFIQFEGENQPRPFEPLNYRWEFVTRADETLTSSVADEILFQPGGFEWQEMGDPPISFLWYNAQLGVGLLREDTLAVYNLLQAHTGENPPFRFAMFEPDFQFCETVTNEETNETSLVIPGRQELPCSMQLWISLLAEYDITLIWTNANDFEVRQNLLIDTILRRMYAEYWGNALVPEWFITGLSQLYRRTGNLPALAVAQNASAQDRLLTLPQLQQPAIAEQQPLWEAQSYLFLLYLADTYGADVPFELARALNGAADFETAFQGVTGQPLENDYRAFLSWIDTQGAEVAAAWNPYLPDTPTPTPTRTETPIPPSDTPTLTPSITLTPTSTSLVERIPTLSFSTPTSSIPTITQTPSNTPRPPGSLSSPTPVPVVAQAPAEKDSNLPCGASAIVVPALGIVLWSNRKRTL